MMQRPSATPRQMPPLSPTQIPVISLHAAARALRIPTASLIAYLQANGGFPDSAETPEAARMRNQDTQT